MRELTEAEIAQVADGIVPVLIVAGAFVGGVGVGFSLVAVADALFD